MFEMEVDKMKSKITYLSILTILLAFSLYFLSRTNYLFFHSIVELAVVIIAFLFFVIAIIAKKYNQNNILVIMGIGYLCVAIVEVLHMLSYKGMGVFPGYTSNLPTQLWIIARYIETITILFSLLFVNRKYNFKTILAVYIFITLTFTILAFNGLFPDSFIEGTGLTPFKVISEYIIISVLLLSLFLVYKKRIRIGKEIAFSISLAILFTIFAEVSFTFYSDVYGISNMLGHVFTLISVIFLYLSIITTGVKKPYDTIFYELKKMAEQNIQQYMKLFNNMYEGITLNEIIYDDEGNPIDYRIIDINPAFKKLLNLSDNDIKNKSSCELYNVSKPPFFAVCLRISKNLSTERFEFFFKTLNKHFLISSYGTEKDKFINVFHDVTKEVQAKKLLYTEKELVKTTLESIGDGLITTDKKGSIVLINKVAQELTGWNYEEAVGKQLELVFNIINGKTGIKVGNPVEKVLKHGLIIGLANHTVLISKKGIRYHISNNAAPITNMEGELFGVVLVFSDISQDYLKQEKIKYISYHDNLTGLYNRAFLEEKIKSLNINEELPISFIIIDINGLKMINDSFGYKEGDLLMIKIANILKNNCNSRHIISRWGGSEFVLLLPKTKECDANNICNRINSDCIKIRIKNLILSVSLGHATKTKVSGDIQETMKEAEESMYRHKLLENKSIRSAIVLSLGNTLHQKNLDTEEHAQRMCKYCIMIGKELNLDDKYIDELILLAKLHDIGKIAIEEHILQKFGKLTVKEWKEIKRHSKIGYDIAESLNELKHISKGILSHHEKWDGSGYPEGLTGESIPLTSRIISIIDSYDAMTNDRSYRKAMPKKTAIKELIECSGTQFDTTLVNIFINIINGEI